MKRDFLKSIGVADDLIDKIMAENGDDIEREKKVAEKAKADLNETRQQLDKLQADYDTLKKNANDVSGVQSKLDELQKKYDTDTAALQAQLSARDYTDAISAAISGYDKGKGLRFSSKGAEKAFTVALKEKKLTLKDGALEGFEDFVKEQMESDPDSFSSNKPKPNFSKSIGAGTEPQTEAPGMKLAREIGKQKAAARANSNAVMSYYTGGTYIPPQQSTNSQ